MFKWIKSSLYAKLVTVFLLVTLLPMLIIWSVYSFTAKEQIIEEKLREISNLSKQISTSLNDQLQQIRFDLNLNVKYEIFDDIIVSDLDQRIANFLSDKHSHMLHKGEFHVVNMDGSIIASSIQKVVGKTFKETPLKTFYSIETSKFSQKKVIILTKKVFMSFDRTKQIGYLVHEYDTQNLENFTSSDAYATTFFYNPTKGYVYGNKIANTKFYQIKDKQGFFFTDELIFSYQALKGKEFEGFYLIQALNKSKVMSFYNQFSQTILLSMLFGLIMVVLIGSKLVKIFTTPINQLSEVAKQIEAKKDYSIRVKTKGEDEIAFLGATINNLLETVQSMMEHTQKESSERLRILTQLIYFFNAITQENDEETVFEVARQRVGEFLNESVEIDHKENDTKFQKLISYKNIKTNEKIICGFMSYTSKERSTLEEQFLQSIATMVGLQMERLHLVEEANSASEAKSSFISNMSHELRTPLNAILGFSQILNKKVESEKEKRMVDNILTAGKHLLNLINDILDIAKIEAGKIDIHVEEIDVYTLVNEVEVITSKLAINKGLYYKTELEATFSISTDTKLLKQILVNQLSNAIKFTENGGVIIKVWADELNAYFDIIDTGVGISQENINKLFKEFVQIDNGLQDKQKGTGLGLVLSKNLAQELGGDLVLSSVEGRGTIAHVSVTKELKKKA